MNPKAARLARTRKRAQLELSGERAPLDLSRKSGLVARPDAVTHTGDRIAWAARGLWLVSLQAGRATWRSTVRWARAVWGVAGFLSAAAVTALLGLHPELGAPAWATSVVGNVAGVVLAHRVWVRLRRSPLAVPEEGRWLRPDIELALLSVAVGYLVLDVTGGAHSILYPALYLTVAVLVIAHPPLVGLAAVIGALGLELLVAWRGDHLRLHPQEVAAHGAFVTGFAVLYHLALAGKIAMAGQKAKAEISAHLSDIRERARTYRLVQPEDDGESRAAADDKWLVASVEAADQAVLGVLGLAETMLRTHTVGFWLLPPEDEDGLYLQECRSGSDRVSRRRIGVQEGLPGVVLRRRAPVRLAGGFRGAVYYDGGPAPKAFLGVPVIERTAGGHAWVRGVLLADRLAPEPFTEQDEKVLEALAGEIHRSLRVERLLFNTKKQKDETTRFHKAVETLNKRSKTREICAEVARLVLETDAVETVAVTLVDRGEEGAVRHRVVEADGPGAEAWHGLEFDDNAGLVAQTFHYKTPMPGRPFHDMDRPVVFDERIRVRGLGSLKIVPMLAGEEVVGTVVCGAKRRRAFDIETVGMLTVLAVQAANAIQRGRLFEQTERLATTDGLTGLLNHRRFQERFDEILAAARRYERGVALVLADVDHFKSVNDTYGHPVGDVVLKGVARVLRAEARDSDVVARYGGEEFAVILPETAVDGAVATAERIRRRIEAEVFHTELGPLQITLSLGVAAFPGDGEEKQTLVDRADQALYAAKHGGRNNTARADRL